jgi:hypothetical protein
MVRASTGFTSDLLLKSIPEAVRAGGNSVFAGGFPVRHFGFQIRPAESKKEKLLIASIVLLRIQTRFAWILRLLINFAQQILPVVFIEG